MFLLRPESLRLARTIITTNNCDDPENYLPRRNAMYGDVVMIKK